MVRKRVFNNGEGASLQYHENLGKNDAKGGRMKLPHNGIRSWKFYVVLALPIAVICAVAVIAFHVYNRHQSVDDVTKKANLPPASVPESYDEMTWGTYRSHMYFGLRNRHLQSPLFGMMWFEQPRGEHVTSLPLRHWCSLVDGTVFLWEDHDGRSFGHQNVTDNGLALETDWFNHEHSWSARISVNGTKKDIANSSYAVVFYFALQDTTSTLQPILKFDAPTGSYSILQGNSPLFGNFQLGMKVGDGVRAEHFSHLVFDSEQLPAKDRLLDMTMVNNIVLYAMRRKPNGDLVLTDFQHGVETPNFVAVQVNLAVDATRLEVALVDENSSHMPPFDVEFERRVNAFRSNFSRTFNLGDDVPEEQVKMGRAALSNMLGSIGYWNGYSRVTSDLFKPGEVKLYGPLALLSAVPSRPTFPRGFIWDEGFHNLLIRQMDPTFSLDIISSWLDTMNVEGWIPREMVLGREAETLIPAEYLVQSDSVANPPMFFYLLEKFMNDPNFMVEYGWRLRRWYPRLKLWYNWLKETQVGPLVGSSFRWRGRNSTTILELNPKTLPSGLDDFPRASHPNEKEYHLDLRCWMAMASRVLRRLCENVEDMAWIATVEEDVRHFNDLSTLDKLHWSDSKQAYFDYGLHSNSVELVKVRKPPPLQHEFTYVRRVNSPPKLQLVDDVFGYVNLFPFLLKMLPADSSKLNAILKRLDHPNLLWTPYGLRSIAKSSPYYMKRNTEYDMPYWRGPIWINMNYLALEALQHYSRQEAEGTDENSAMAGKLYDSLRRNLVKNIAEQYKTTGALWEHYDDVNGEGSGTRPFTGWTALVLGIMANKYD